VAGGTADTKAWQVENKLIILFSISIMNEITRSKEKETQFLPVKLRFYPDKGSAVLLLDKKNINFKAKKEAAEKLDLLPKEEFHFTIIGSDTGETILAQLANLPEPEKNITLEKIDELLQSFDWQTTITDDFYYLQKIYNEPEFPGEEKRRSIIQLAKIDQLEEFYIKLNSLLGTNFSTPLPHVTIYTNSNREDKKLRGIGLYSQKDFNDLKPEKI
jgi:hypothetical protein